MTPRVDLAIVGSGFGGSLLATIARKLGLSVVLLEKGVHPRFAIGESSSPLANLLLESLCRRYGLSEIEPLAKWGTWQAARPEIGCGKKRGFSFFHHTPGLEFGREPERRNELLVEASPADPVADTHWYRADVDAFFARQAEAAGAELVDRIALDVFKPSSEGVRVGGVRSGRRLAWEARYLIDASGPRGFVHHTLGLDEKPFAHFPPTHGLYAHFHGVRRWEDVAPPAGRPPYAVDDAALHHVFPGGWIWVLRFSNGVTSAGASLSPALAERVGAAEGAAGWERLLGMLPSVGRQFEGSSAIRPFSSVAGMPYRTATADGPGWSMLPSAAAFVDPLLSTGFPLTLLGIERIALALEEAWGKRSWEERMAGSSRLTLEEADRAALLVGALFDSFDDFELFSAVAMLYFASASYAEARRRLGGPAQTFLSGRSGDDTGFRAALETVADRVRGRDGGSFGLGELIAGIRKAIAPLNVAGLLDPSRRNWYPVVPADLLENAEKLEATRDEVGALIARSGFPDSPDESRC